MKAALNPAGSKRMAAILILEILRQYSDDEHRLTQQDIIHYLKKDYDLECDRRTVRNNLQLLQDAGYDISMEDGYCLFSRDFDDAELRMLIDSVLFSKILSKKQAKTLIDKLKSQGNIYFNAKVSHVSGLSDMQRSDNKQLLYCLDAINDAIDRNRKISFIHNHYETDFRLHPGANNPYIVSPYQVVANNSRYYLICWDEHYEDLCYYRIDRITDVEILADRRKPMRLVPGLEKGLDLPKHMAEHVYMFRGESVPIRLKTKKSMMGELIDWFGKDFRIMETDGDDMIVRIVCNETSAFYWSLQYGMYVEVLEPAALREKITAALKEISARYDKDV